MLIPVLVVLLASPTFLSGQTQTISASPSSLSFYHQTGTASPPQQNVQITASATLSTTVTIAAQGGNWLFVTPISGTTPYSLTVLVIPTGLPPGVYTGSITIAAQGATSASVAVTFTISNSPLLTPNPSSLTFDFALNAPAPANQMINLGSTTAGVPFSTAASTSSGGSWLSVLPMQGSAPTALTVSVTVTGLAVGTYNGSITVAAAAAGNSPLVIPVTLRVVDEIRLSASPTSFTIDYQVGTPNPPDRTVSIATTSVPVAFTAAVATSSGGAWLALSAASGTTPQNLVVSVNPTGLGAGDYQGTITVTAASATNSPLTIPVTLRVRTEPLLIPTPASLAFTFQVGGSTTARQTVLVTNFGSPIPLAVAATTTPAGGTWLSVTPASGSTPLAILVSVNASGLTPGTYNGNVTVTGTAANSPLAIPVTVTVSGTPLPRLSQNQLSFHFQTGGNNPPNRTITVSSTGAAIPFTAAATTQGGGTWLSVTPASGNTAGDLTVSVAATGLPPGIYAGSVTVSAASVVLTVPVQLTISTNPLLTVSPEVLNFAFASGGALPANQSITTQSTGAAFSFAAAATTASGAAWLVLAPASGTTGANVAAGVNPLGLGEGLHTAVIAFSAAGVANSPQYVPVIFTVSSSSDLVVPPAPLVFNQAIGGTAAAPQTVNISASGTILPYTASAATLSGGNWLSVTPTSGLTPAALTVSVNATGLEPGSYGGTITISSAQASNSPRIIPVTLNVTRAFPNLNVSQTSLSFSFTPGGTAPPSQGLTVSSSAEPIGFNAAASTTDGRNWLSINPSGALVTPMPINVSVNVTGLASGTYNGAITLTSPNAANTPRTVTVTLVVAAVQAPVLTAFVNAASFAPTAAVPGLIVTLGGTGIGPTQPAFLQLTPAGLVATVLAGTRVLFEGIPAPLVAVSSTQTSAVVPYAIFGRLSTRVQVEVNGVLSNALDLRVAEAAPGIFTQNQQGFGLGAILNENNTLNGMINAAARDSIISGYATGEGQTMPAGIDGSVPGTGGVALRRPLLPPRVRIGGIDAEVTYFGSAPGYLAGLIQFNARIPNGVTPGNAVPIEIIVGTASSQAGVTIVVR